MVEIDLKAKTYVCPFCRCRQSYANSCTYEQIGHNRYNTSRTGDEREADFQVTFLQCTNTKCKKISAIAFNSGKQIDLIPEFTCKHFPDYIPEQIRNDYIEGVAILRLSPKAAATMFRRCLQGMIRNFWNIKRKRLIDEIAELESKVTASQWKAIDGTRKIGNIGAHMEHDVNFMLDVDPKEAEQLQKLIELLLEKWYIARYEEEDLANSIITIANDKENQKTLNKALKDE